MKPQTKEPEEKPPVKKLKERIIVAHEHLQEVNDFLSEIYKTLSEFEKETQEKKDA